MKLLCRTFVGFALLAAVTGPAALAVTVDVYSGIGDYSTGGAPYSGLVGSFTSPDIMFATNTGYAWHPFGLGAFGADITGCLDVAADGTYSFTLNSDDGSLLYIDGSLVVNNGGPHGPWSVTNSASLTAGMHPFEVQFYEDFGGPSGVDLYLPAGVSYCIPLPAAGWMGMSLMGVIVSGGLLRRNLRRA